MAIRLARCVNIFNSGRSDYNMRATHVYNRQQGDDVGGAIASERQSWIKSISDRRGFTVDLLTQLCGGPASGKPIELWLPSDLDAPEKCRECWGADPLARVAINRPPLRALRFLNGDGSTFQVAFEAQTQSGQWLAINDWLKGAEQKFGDRLWLDWVKPSQRSHLGKYLSPVGEGAYRPVWTPDFGAAGKPLDWGVIGGNKFTPKHLTEGPWKGVSAWFDLGLVPIVLAGVDAGVVGQGHDDRGQLRPEVAKLLAAGAINIAFDQDARPATVKKVAESIDRLVKAIRKLKPANPKAKGNRTHRIIRGAIWPGAIDGRSTKGIDDLVQVAGIKGAIAQIKTVPIERLIARGRAITITKKPDIEIELQGTESLANYADQVREAIKQGYRNIALYAPTGAGKGELIKAINELNNRPLIYISPRNALNESEAKELNATPRSALDSFSYLSESSGWTTEKLPPDNRRITMCVEGFESISVAKFCCQDTVVFGDEFDQTFDQLIGGGTLKSKVRKAFDWLSDMFRTAGIRIIASAGLRDQHIEWLKETTGDDVFLVSAKRVGDETKYEAKMDQGKDYSAVLDRLETAVTKNNESVMLAWDNRGLLTAFKEYFDRTYIDGNGNPKYRFLIVTRDTSSDPEVKALISGKGDWLQQQRDAGNPVHILGFTTTLGTGWNLKDPDTKNPLFKTVLGIHGGTITPEAFRQMVNRLRLNCPRVIWAKSRSARRGRTSKATTQNGVIYDLIESRRRAAKATRSAEDFAALETSRILEEKTLFLRMFAESTANENATRELSREVLAAKLQAEGRAIDWAFYDNNEALRQDVLEVREELRRARAIALYNAPKLTLQEYLNLERKEAKTKDDYIAIDRFKFDDYYLLNLSDLDEESAINLVLADAEGSRRSGLRQLSRVLQKYHAMHVSRDIASIYRAIENRALWDVKNDSAISNVFAALRFSEILKLESYTIKTPLIQEIYETARGDKKLMAGVRRWLDSEGKILNASSATAFVNAILRGIDVEVFLEKETKTWFIDQARLAESIEILDRQFTRWQQQNQLATQVETEAKPEPIAQTETQSKPTPEPIAQEPIGQPETMSTVITQPKPTPEPIEFWTVVAGKHQGDKVRIDATAKDGRIRVSPVGKFGSYLVDSVDLKPIAQEPLVQEPIAQEPIAQEPIAQTETPLARAQYLYGLWVAGDSAAAAAVIKGWFKMVDRQSDPLGLSRLKTAVCEAMPEIQAFWDYALLYG